MYSQKDDIRWFVNVTDELYRNAVRQKLPTATAPVLQQALDQVYSSRATAEQEGDVEFLKHLSALVHVETDLAWTCPIAVGEVIPKDIPLYDPRRGEDGTEDMPMSLLDDLVHRAAPRKTVLLVGSWT